MIQIKQIPAQFTWPIRHQVMWPNETIDFVKVENDETGLHFGLYVDDQLTSVVSLFSNNKEAQFRKFATLSSHQGKGYGSRLLKHLFEEIKSKNIQRVWCNARQDKISFYQKFEMKETTSTFSKKGIQYVIMEKLIQ